MDKLQIKEFIGSWGLNTEFVETRQNLEIILPAEILHDTALKLKNSRELQFDFLLSETAIDWSTHFTTVYHLTSSVFHHIIVLKVNISDHEKPEIDTLSDIWITAEFQEREIFDLFGIKFRGHNDLRRLFLDDDWGFPLRKDYTDENIKELK
jgi:NADH:ubiquinone oxidoreductase subunit C